MVPGKGSGKGGKGGGVSSAPADRDALWRQLKRAISPLDPRVVRVLMLPEAKVCASAGRVLVQPPRPPGLCTRRRPSTNDRADRLHTFYPNWLLQPALSWEGWLLPRVPSPQPPPPSLLPSTRHIVLFVPVRRACNCVLCRLFPRELARPTCRPPAPLAPCPLKWCRAW